MGFHTLALCALLLVRLAQATIVIPAVPFPATNQQKHSELCARSAVVGDPVVYDKGHTPQGAYHVLARGNETFGDVVLGRQLDQNGNPIFATSSGTFKKKDELAVSVYPDYQSLFTLDGEVISFVQFENPNPGVAFCLKLDQNAQTGSLRIKTAQVVDFSAWGGLWIPCAGSTTPWKSHLGAEEFEPDARLLLLNSYATYFNQSSNNTRVTDMMRYFGVYLSDVGPEKFWSEVQAKFNPYRYGWATEMYVDKSGKGVARKWYTLGRLSWEVGLVLPDNKTVVVGDDGRQCAMIKFVADKPGDLYSGTLYAAKLTQVSPTNSTGGRFNVSWIRLGSANQGELEALLKKNTTSIMGNPSEQLRFSDIFEYVRPNGTTCPEGFKFVFTSPGQECLKLKQGAEKAAAFFETRRYAGYLGATTEFEKFEGVAYDPLRHRVYAAMSTVSRGMEEEPRRPEDHIRLRRNDCGCVYYMDLDKDYSAYNMVALTCGDKNYTLPGMSCNPDAIANPDNLAMYPSQDMLIIYEDTSEHDTNFLWGYHLATGEMSRLARTVVGAEFTGGSVFTINGYDYIWANLQHPYDDVEEIYENFTTYSGIDGWMGYLGPFKVEGQKGEDGKVIQLGFDHVGLAWKNESKNDVVASKLVAFGTRQNISCEDVQVTGEKYGSGVFGVLFDKDGKPVKAKANDTKAYVSNYPDINALMNVCGKLYMVTQFEDPNPGAMYISPLVQDEKTGKLTAVDTYPVDWAPLGGLWNPCAGSISNWNTRLGSEEYEPDARAIQEAKDFKEFPPTVWPFSLTVSHAKFFNRYLDENSTDPLTTIRSVINPYLYGYTTEVVIECDGTYKAIKHYCGGRFSHELAITMPDNKTVYSTDDGANVGFFKFVADKAKDLSAGTLYAAKATQISDEDGGSFLIRWIELGRSNNSAIEKLARSLKFSDIFETASGNKTNGTCPSGFRSVVHSYGFECLKLKKGMETAAAFLETRRYAAYLGGTTEFNKWEGIDYDAKRHRLYTAMSGVADGMEDNASRGNTSITRFDAGGPNHVRLPWNRCGCVYYLDVDQTYSAVNMKPLVCGVPNSAVKDNACRIDGIAEPDNLNYIEGHDQLLIAEDSGSGHQNDIFWMYDLQTESLTRIITTPYGSEASATVWYPNLKNGWSYIGRIVQHPYSESDQAKLNETERYKYGREAAAGYLGPFKYAGDPEFSEGTGSGAPGLVAAYG